ncbi:MAG: diaminopimelate epimerase [Ilumatobacteraceae bacterium]
MTTVRLSKFHGLGNDFLVVLGDSVPALGDPAGAAVELCDRRRGIGADGLLLGSLADGYTARMVLHNADGSRAEISGNGIRCFAHALWLEDATRLDQRIATDAGDRLVSITPGADPTAVHASVDMGDVSAINAPSRWAALECDPRRPVAHLSLGNPHSVVAVDDVWAVDLVDLGGRVPEVNLEIVEVGPEDQAITMRVHERGVGITDACGSGACASAWAARQWGMVSASEVLVHMPGGDAVVRVDHPAAGRVTLVGPSTYVGAVLVDR